MVNLATYVGSSQAGFWGALIATAAVVLRGYVCDEDFAFAGDDLFAFDKGDAFA